MLATTTARVSMSGALSHQPDCLFEQHFDIIVNMLAGALFWGYKSFLRVQNFNTDVHA